MNIGNQEKSKQAKFYHLFLYLIQLIEPYVIQLRIRLTFLIEMKFEGLITLNI